jgi:putative transposase
VHIIIYLLKSTTKIKFKLDTREEGINKMAKNIAIHKNDIWCPTGKLDSKNIKLNSWFTINEFNSPKEEIFKENEYELDEKEDVKYNSKRILLDLTLKQKMIINEWLNSYLNMYNAALKYVKNNIKTDKKVLNFQYLRSKLKNEKEKLVKKSSIKVHDIDYAIKLVCQNYKSALTNYKMGNIKEFRIRFWRTKKENKVMDLEKDNFSKKGIRHLILGEVKGYYNGEQFNFSEVGCDSKLQKKNGNYYLYVPNLIDKITDNKTRNKVITIDPGIRRFGTGITENKVIKIGEGCSLKIENYLKRKDGILKNENINKVIKKKNEKMINKKISNLVDDLHWKTINYLTENNEKILIGNMSSKGIVSKKGNLNKMTKRIAQSLRFYEFRSRLKYKCNIKNAEYGNINEWMTSKMCSMCGNVKENLGGNEKYECVKCGIKMERDINGARNIHMRAIKK